MSLRFGKVMKSIREQNGWTLEEMANRLGTTKQALSKYERGERTPKITIAAGFAEKLGVRLEDLIGADALPPEIMRIEAMNLRHIPMIGSVAAGEPIYDEEFPDVYVDAPTNCDYALRVKGDSMEPTYKDGDVVYIKMAQSVREGAVAVVLLDDEVCMKHVYFVPNGLQLISENPKYPPKICTFPDYYNIRVLGEVVGYTRMFR